MDVRIEMNQKMLSLNVSFENNRHSEDLCSVGTFFSNWVYNYIKMSASVKQAKEDIKWVI